MGPLNAAADTPAPFPERLGRYEVLLPIASGGMATVFLARSTGIAGFEREVALKLTHGHLRDDPDFVLSLMDEARLAGRIRHPNVVSVLDVAQDPHGVFIVMDYIEGDSLANVSRALRKRESKLPAEIAVRVLDDMLAGLHAAHELRDPDGELLRVVHRDVTPQNVLLGVDGATRLTDFGIAKAATQLGRTGSGLIKGKIGYMSPEQAQGHTLDRTCDVWAAGVIAWELFSGMRLYDGPHEAAVLLRVVREPPTKLGRVAPDVPKAIEEAIAGALTLDPKERWPSAEAFAQALTRALKTDGIVRADVRDVAEFLRPLLADKLGSRQRKVREVQALRKRMGEIAKLKSRPANSSPSLPEISDLGSGEVSASDVSLPAHAELDADQDAPTRAVGVATAEQSGARIVATEMERGTGPVGSALSKQQRIGLAALGGVLVLTLFVALLVALVGRSGGAAAGASASVPLAPANPGAASGAPSVEPEVVATPAEPAPAPAPELAAEPEPVPLPAPEPVAEERKVSAPRATPKPAPAPGSTPGRPLNNPYKKP